MLKATQSGQLLHLFSALTADSLSLPLQGIETGISLEYTVHAKERSVSQSGQDFGANDWLVEEMYERFQSDPSSVPAEWVTYFQNNPQTGAQVAKAPSAGVPPTPKPLTPPNISMSSQAGTTPAAPVPTPATAVAAPVTTAPVATPIASQPIVREVAPTSATPADPVAKPIPTLVTPGAATMEPLRGVAGRVV